MYPVNAVHNVICGNVIAVGIIDAIIDRNIHGLVIDIRVTFSKIADKLTVYNIKQRFINIEHEIRFAVLIKVNRRKILPVTR